MAAHISPRSMGVPPVDFGVSPKSTMRRTGETPEMTGETPMLRGDLRSVYPHAPRIRDTVGRSRTLAAMAE